MHEPMPVEQLWSVDDVANVLKASRSWVYLHVATGELPSVRIAGLLRFDPAAIRALSAPSTLSVRTPINRR